MLIEGVVLGGVSLLGFGLTYKKLPEKLKKVIIHHPVMTEIVMVVFFYEFLGMTVIAHIACGTMVLGAHMLFHVARNPKDYQFLTDAVEAGKQQLLNIRKQLQELNERHVAAKLESVK